MHPLQYNIGNLCLYILLLLTGKFALSNFLVGALCAVCSLSIPRGNVTMARVIVVDVCNASISVVDGDSICKRVPWVHEYHSDASIYAVACAVLTIQYR